MEKNSSQSPRSPFTSSFFMIPTFLAWLLLALPTSHTVYAVDRSPQVHNIRRGLVTTNQAPMVPSSPASNQTNPVSVNVFNNQTASPEHSTSSLQNTTPVTFNASLNNSSDEARPLHIHGKASSAIPSNANVLNFTDPAARNVNQNDTAVPTAASLGGNFKQSNRILAIDDYTTHTKDPSKNDTASANNLIPASSPVNINSNVHGVPPAQNLIPASSPVNITSIDHGAARTNSSSAVLATNNTLATVPVNFSLIDHDAIPTHHNASVMASNNTLASFPVNVTSPKHDIVPVNLNHSSNSSSNLNHPFNITNSMKSPSSPAFSHRLNESSRSNSKLNTKNPPLKSFSLQNSPTEAFIKTLPNPCEGLPLTPDTWKKFDLDNYLQNYSNGRNTSLQEYAFLEHAQNFICGIGEGCHAGQLCNPVTAPAWYVLYAAQEWNSLQNSIYTAIGFAVSMVQATAAALVTDLFGPEHHSLLFHLQDLFILLAGIAFTVSFASMLFTPFAGVVVASTVAGALFAGTSSALMGVNMVRSWDAVPDGFTRWAGYDYYISQWQSKVQDQLSNSTSAIIQAGISNEDGMYGVLKGGAFLSEIQVRSMSEVEDDIKRTSTARILVDILRAQGAYVTYNTDSCNGKGPGGAWPGKNVLSFCKDGVMMNIVKANKKKTENKWFNANLIVDKYGFTTEYLVTQSWECQKKYKGFSYDPYRNGSLPLDINSECVVNLPVCDLTDPNIKHAISKHRTTTRACREVGKLPI